MSDHPDTAKSPLNLLIVTIGDQHFGVDINIVNTILPRQDSTHVPQSGEKVSGLINLRGHIVMLVDVRSCLGMAGKDSARMNVTVDHNGELYGLLFDDVKDIAALNPKEMEPVPAILDERWNGMAAGIFRRPDTLLIMLDTQKLIDAACPTADKPV